MQKDILLNNFKNVYFTDGEKPVICYRFGTTVYEEVFDAGRFASVGWNTSGYPQNVLENQPTRINIDMFAEPQAFDLEADGRSLAFDWKFCGLEQKTEKEELSGNELLHAAVTLESRLMPLSVKVHTLLDGTSVMTRFIEVINTGDAPVNLNAIAPMCGGMEVIPEWDEYLTGEPLPEKLYSLGYFESSRWAQEGQFRWHAMPNAGYSVTGSYRNDRYRHPFFALRSNALGSFFFAQLGWTGGFDMSFRLDAEDICVGMSTTKRLSRMSFRMGLDSQKPIRVLTPGEHYLSPSVHIGCLQGDLDDAVNAMHSHIRKSVFTFPAGKQGKGLIEAGIGPERTMTLSAIEHIAKTAADVGAQTVIIDAGWNIPDGTEADGWVSHVGDWHPATDKYRADLSDVRDVIHKYGLIFGLWLDAERIGSLSDAFIKHPEWVAKRFNGDKVTSMIDMANPEATAWVESEIDRCITEYGVELFRLDYNIGGPDTFNRIITGNTDECGTVKYYENTCAMYRRLRKKHPDVVFENCAGGGGRTDLAFVANFSHTWVSDWQIAPRSFSITNGMTMVLPPETVDRLASGMECHTRASLDFQVRHTLFGRPTTNSYNPNGSEFNPGQIAYVRHSYDIYNEYVRPYIDGSRIFHHTPECSGLRPKGTGVLERVSEDGSAGIIGIFNLANPSDEVTVVYPRGLDESKTYDLLFDNKGTHAEVSGYTLVNDGIRVRLDGALTSELIAFRAID